MRLTSTEAAASAYGPGSDNFTMSLKKALDSLRDYPIRVFDATSAQEVKGIGPAVAKVRNCLLSLSLFLSLSRGRRRRRRAPFFTESIQLRRCR